jgi:hypothetical protein
MLAVDVVGERLSMDSPGWTLTPPSGLERPILASGLPGADSASAVLRKRLIGLCARPSAIETGAGEPSVGRRNSVPAKAAASIQGICLRTSQ